MARERIETARSAANEGRVFGRPRAKMTLNSTTATETEERKRKKKRKKDRNLIAHLQALVERVGIHLHGELMRHFRAGRRRGQGLLSVRGCAFSKGGKEG